VSLYDLIYYLDRLHLDTLKFRVIPVLNAESAAAIQVLYVAQAAEEKVGMFPFQGLSCPATTASLFTIKGAASSESIVLYQRKIFSNEARFTEQSYTMNIEGGNTQVRSMMMKVDNMED
jgi:hypothetical protein